MREYLRHIVLSLLLPTFCIQLAIGQYYFDRFTNIGGEEEVRGHIAKSSDGFIWVGTNKGLYRYDGRNYKTYRHDPKDSTSLQSDRIHSILAVKDKLWLGTDYGVSVFDLFTQTFKNYTFTSEDWLDWKSNFPYNRVRAIFQDRQGEIWLGTQSQGIWRFEAKTETFQAYSERKYDLPNNRQNSAYYINSFCQSAVNDSIIWAAMNIGLLAVNKYSGKQELYPFRLDDPQNGNPYAASLRVYAHDDSTVYTGGWGGGVYTLDQEKRSFQKIKVRSDPDSILTKWSVRAFHRVSEDQIWISGGQGVGLYNIKTSSLDYWKKSILADQEYYGISLIDQRNRIWHNTNKGIYLFDPHLQQFQVQSYSHLFTKLHALSFYLEFDAARNTVVVCPRGAEGIYHYNRTTGAWKRYPLDLSGVSRDRVYGFVILSPDEYLLSTRNGLRYYKLGSGKTTKIKIPDSIRPENLRQVLLTSNDEIWIATFYDGIYKTDRSFQEFTSYKEELVYGNPGLSVVGDLLEDSQKNIWIKRSNGVSVYDRGQDRFHNFIYQVDTSNTFRAISCFAEDLNGRVWIASDNGLIGYAEAKNPERGVVKKMNLRDFGVEGYIHELERDARGRVWGITSDDMVVIDPNGERPRVQKFSLRYGAKDYDIYSFKILPDDEMYLGGTKEILRTNAQQLRRNDELPIPYISSLNIRNEGDQKAYPLFGNEPVQLKHSQNFFTIFYSAQAFTLGDKVQFKYRLKGFDDWNEVGNSQIATYTNVPSGEYIFELKAANNEGIWNEEALCIPMSIDQPWYTSWWFILSALLFLGLFILSIYQYRINQIKNEAELKTTYEKKLAEVEMNALLAQMNPHFIFNSLNSIDSFILKNESRRASEYLNDFARLIRLILHNSRSESIRIADELETLELYLKMEQLRFKDRFEYSIQIDDAIAIDHIEMPPMLVQPYVENAVWHGIMHLPKDKQGRLDVKIIQDNGYIKIEVLDNGVGRKKAMEIKLNKIDHKKSMGMKITNDRIDLINTLYKTNAKVKITDLYSAEQEALGTQVLITLTL